MIHPETNSVWFIGGSTKTEDIRVIIMRFMLGLKFVHLARRRKVMAVFDRKERIKHFGDSESRRDDERTNERSLDPTP
jgi:hypothetical protein